jgi:hypothetical protein
VLEVALYCLSLVLGVAVPALIVRVDLSRLSGARLERSWPDAGLWSAVVFFGVLSVPIHIIRTRRSLLGILWGIVWFALAVAAVVLPVAALTSWFMAERLEGRGLGRAAGITAASSLSRARNARNYAPSSRPAPD